MLNKFIKECIEESGLTREQAAKLREFMMPQSASLGDSARPPQGYRNVDVDQPRQNPPDFGNPNEDGNGGTSPGTDHFQAYKLESLSEKPKAQWNNLNWKSFTDQFRFPNFFPSTQNSNPRGWLNTAPKLKPFKAF